MKLEFVPIPTHPLFVDLTGRVFDRLTVLGYAGKQKRNSKWHCQCSCGTIKTVFATGLHNGDNRSCGCYMRENNGRLKYRHGHKGSRTYRCWSNMMQRCTNPNNPAWKHYGGRGIVVCDGWRDFVNFLRDMGQCPPRGEIDRHPNNNGNYEPGNCRWIVSQSDQMRNTRRNRPVLFRGETKLLSDWCHERGLAFSTVHWRLAKGWDVERALSAPPQPTGRNVSGRRVLQNLQM